MENLFHPLDGLQQKTKNPQMEEFLDDVSAGSMEWKKLLTGFWAKFIKNIEQIQMEKNMCS